MQMSAVHDNEANEFFFQDKDEEVCIGVVPPSEVSYFPRVGEIVSLPRYEGSDGGYYVITHIVHSFIAEPVSNDIKFCSRRFYVRAATGDDMPRRNR